ncbi:MAG: hypothetical protein JNL67_23120 [Planctomycetaceae bacterium]|nr:hypothetical protein [Planctomycetaceae bacterium]
MLFFAFFLQRFLSSTESQIGHFFTYGAILGCWYAPTLLSRYRLTQRLKSLWGWPQFSVSDLMCLMVWLSVIALLAQHAVMFQRYIRDAYPAPPAVFSIAVLAASICFFFWVRATWLLQQCNVHQPTRRLVFYLAVLPATILANVNAGLCVIVLLGFVFGILHFLQTLRNHIEEAAFVALVAACPIIELMVLTKLIRIGMRFVIGEDSASHSGDVETEGNS